MERPPEIVTQRIGIALSLTNLLTLWHRFRVPILVACIICCAILAPRWYRARSSKSAHTGPFNESKKTQQGLTSLVVHNVPARQPSPTAKSPKNLVSRRRPTETVHAKSSNAIPGKIRAAKVPSESSTFSLQVTIFFSSLSGTTNDAAVRLLTTISKSLKEGLVAQTHIALDPRIVDLSNCEYDDYFIALPKTPQHGTGGELDVRHFYIVLTPTYNIDTYLDTFLEYLQEVHYDFRVDTRPLSQLLGYAVFGFGDRKGWPTEEAGFCSSATSIDKWLAKLTGGKRAYPVGMGDVTSNAAESFDAWRKGVEAVLHESAATFSLGQGVPGSGDALESDEEPEEEVERPRDLAAKPTRRTARLKSRRSPIDDLEDIGGVIAKSVPSAKYEPTDYTTISSQESPVASAADNRKEMVPRSSPTYAALTKQGYSIIGSHSGVKICRWTKSALRGRGSCYKFSFYGIKSHLCMETTPSLSCSNKCVFCWRHGTNPVGTTWRWQVDPPEMIFEGAKAGHYQKIKMMRGVPGVRAERFEEAMRIRHCALSLVGEPIFYPHINEFTSLLHNERISTFLVCNAQHPEQLATLKPVTQLYVSIDASNRESLRKIDRPLHRDFWERFCRCLDIIQEKRFRQRTVFRLTLVKGFNIEGEAEGYADLVARGLPCFVEVKGVTYCGTSASAGAGLTMQNVPFYEEVCSFVKALDAALARRGLEYGIAAEHAHSCCILLASRRFFLQGRWNTVIDYNRFFECLDSGQDFAPEDYCAETPEWALWGNGGFDPADVRVHHKGKKAKLASQSVSDSDAVKRDV